MCHIDMTEWAQTWLDSARRPCPGSRPDNKTWRFFYFGDLWPEGLLASLTYINGPSGDRQIWKVLHWKSDKYFKMNIRTIQLNGPIQYKILFYTSGPDFVTISTTFMWYFRKNRVALGEHCIPCQDVVQKSYFCNLMLLPYRLLLQHKFMTIWCQIFWWTIWYKVCHIRISGTQLKTMDLHTSVWNYMHLPHYVVTYTSNNIRLNID